MELSLFSRDVIALATGVALSHNIFDAALYLGVCDKIVPGLVIARCHLRPPPRRLRAGRADDHRACPTTRKSKVRQQFATGEVGRDELMEAEMASYHGPGTCTFYGTANTNQMLMEFMGLHLPGAAFVNPGTPPARRADRAPASSARWRSPRSATTSARSADILDERAIVNGMVGLMATGGSTNLVIHLLAMARAAGVLTRPGGLRRSLGSGAADGPGLPERAGRREPFPRRRRARPT